jgi:hypothetical protein
MKQLNIGVATPMPELLVPITNCQFVKPRGGFWTSTFDGQSSAWVDWCRAEEYCDVDSYRWFLLEPRATARILIIDTSADMERLYERYFDASTGLSFLSAIDFEAMAQDYDAMRLTESAVWATRLSLPHNLYGWDCESTCWFRWCFTEVAEIIGDDLVLR